MKRCRPADGSYPSMLGTVAVRVIDCEITIATATGRRTGLYRLIPQDPPAPHAALHFVRDVHPGSGR
ncbi:hypothetical protein ACQPYK_28335 [Streptosporangium sp. CA-135522]|uniref:hypothetical protein n=1 Tax=Streptosporangium sp. CA-135522 TaxID=3240072 RepID=UPI003D94FD56